MRSFIVLLCLAPTFLLAQQGQLETQLKQAIKDKKAEIGIAVIIDGKDTVTVNNDIHYPLMSVFKFHQALDHSVSCCRIIGDIPQETLVCRSVQRLYISDNGGMSNRARPFGCSVVR